MMLQLLLLLVLAYLQDNHGCPAFVWAILYGVMVVILDTLLGLGVVVGVFWRDFRAVYLGVFCGVTLFWGQCGAWLVICVVGLIVPALVNLNTT